MADFNLEDIATRPELIREIAGTTGLIALTPRARRSDAARARGDALVSREQIKTHLEAYLELIGRERESRPAEAMLLDDVEVEAVRRGGRHYAESPNSDAWPSTCAGGFSTRSTLARRTGSLHRQSARRR